MSIETRIEGVDGHCEVEITEGSAIFYEDRQDNRNDVYIAWENLPAELQLKAKELKDNLLRQHEAIVGFIEKEIRPLSLCFKE